MKTRQMSLLRILSVMVLLLFAAPMMDGVLTLFQNESFDETTRLERISLFETSAYAMHDTTATADSESHSHQIGPSRWEKCVECGKKIKEVATIGWWAINAIYLEGGGITYEWLKQREENKTLQNVPHTQEQCVTPP